ncbi:hypothetical protein SCHPADRAFT_319546 [Schizopora paradoxa]|uniref:Uncharacterized protein n=1 Tax=Schizopora paradoxa TaxID=27342 RepID=A0A0H2RRV7_9AGAM|nr:hypothetical protein SCHPADRAFT_319546 [Schizopora paradoxa]
MDRGGYVVSRIRSQSSFNEISLNFAPPIISVILISNSRAASIPRRSNLAIIFILVIVVDMASPFGVLEDTSPNTPNATLGMWRPRCDDRCRFVNEDHLRQNGNPGVDSSFYLQSSDDCFHANPLNKLSVEADRFSDSIYVRRVFFDPAFCRPFDCKWLGRLVN